MSDDKHPRSDEESRDMPYDDSDLSEEELSQLAARTFELADEGGPME